MTEFKIGDIVYLSSQEDYPNGYIIEIDDQDDLNYKIRWFDGWRDTWHSPKFLEKVKALDQSKNR